MPFAAVRIAAELAPADLAGCGAIEIEFASGARMRITGAVAPATVTAQYLSDYYGPPVWIPPDLPPNPAYKTWNNCPPNFAVQNGLCKPYSGRKGQQSSRTQR